VLVSEVAVSVVEAAWPDADETLACALSTGPERLITTPVTSVSIVARIFISATLTSVELFPGLPG
jgi:hypothetical protein